MQYDTDKLTEVIRRIKKSVGKAKLFIVTDFKNLEKDLSSIEFQKLRFHMNVPQDQMIDYACANRYIESLNRFVKREEGVIIQETTIEQDFAFLFYADSLIFLHSTFAWWAGFLGEQKLVLASKHWRPKRSRK